MPSTPHVEHHFTAGLVVRDTVIGLADGLTVPFALAAGLTGAVDSPALVVTASKGWNQFVYDRVDLDGEPYGVSLGLDRQRSALVAGQQIDRISIDSRRPAWSLDHDPKSTGSPLPRQRT